MSAARKIFLLYTNCRLSNNRSVHKCILKGFILVVSTVTSKIIGENIDSLTSKFTDEGNFSAFLWSVVFIILFTCVSIFFGKCFFSGPLVNFWGNHEWEKAHNFLKLLPKIRFQSSEVPSLNWNTSKKNQAPIKIPNRKNQHLKFLTSARSRIGAPSSLESSMKLFLRKFESNQNR